MYQRLLNEARERAEVLRPFFPHLAALGAAAVIGLGVAVVKISSDPRAVDTVDRWPFPQWTPTRLGPQRDTLASTQLWVADPTKTKEVVEVKVAVPPWRFIGTLREGRNRVAVIELDQGKRIQRITNGQPLPNGAVIKNIDTSTLTYDENGVEKVLKLFGVEKTESIADGTGKK